MLVAAAAIARFGRIDTWVNNAGCTIYGRLDEVGEADSRRLFDTNFWGMVNGSLAALQHLRRQGGALVNVGSEASERRIKNGRWRGGRFLLREAIPLAYEAFSLRAMSSAK